MRVLPALLIPGPVMPSLPRSPPLPQETLCHPRRVWWLSLRQSLFSMDPQHQRPLPHQRPLRSHP